ncbi:squalene--hopene cyclase [Anthocerotibacter panamensis]|uniref:squalene--hopene cyclase n=1 Tax=Anthocerotibacter panamensis TaxID=2857077 RepID=UPI001C4041F2|nr:squalene--hopene cyclase [Anthocerotibacter panamensis]
MQAQVNVEETPLESAIRTSQEYLLGLQDPAGYWWAELESNVTMTAEVVLLHKIWGTDQTRPLAKAEAFLRQEQRAHGGWELFYGDGGDLSTSIEAYLGLRLLGVPATDPELLCARDFILQRGGIGRARIFTKLHLALVGCYDWQGIPSLPPWLMLLPAGAPVSIYEMSSWARGSTVPLLIVLDQKPVFKTDPLVQLDELYLEEDRQGRLPAARDWLDQIFLTLDEGFKWAERMDLVPFRKEGLQLAQRWILERQEATGDWGGIIPAMLNSLLALRALGYPASDPIVDRGLQAVDRFGIETEYTYRVQPCVSPVWDTGLVMRALVDSGMSPDHPALVQAGQWLLTKQILDYGDWSFKNPQGSPGGWAFEFENRFYPDVDDTAVVVMALEQVKLPDPIRKQAAITRAVEWVATMQCRDGGWAAFDLDNDQDWLNRLPYADLKAMIDPNTADVTARVLEMYGRARLPLDPACRARALDYLKREQEATGSWFGRWGVNYIYGTSGVLAALSLVAPEEKTVITQAADWLQDCQNRDGGWGETCHSYNDPGLQGQGPSTASQTAWALIGLLAAAEATGYACTEALERGVAYLVKTQHFDGRWDEPEFTGTGFPGHFYLKYHLYQQHFPLTALGRYRAWLLR